MLWVFISNHQQKPMCEHVIHFFVTFTFIFPFPFPFACFPFTVYSHSPIFKTMLFCLIFFIHSFIHYMSSSRWAFKCRQATMNGKNEAGAVRQAVLVVGVGSSFGFGFDFNFLATAATPRFSPPPSPSLRVEWITNTTPHTFVNTATGHFLLCRKSL